MPRKKLCAPMIRLARGLSSGLAASRSWSARRTPSRRRSDKAGVSGYRSDMVAEETMA